ncbi:MAG: hypothetical protein LC659_07480, partial [Myxococcales bacterium]|nr:hypothetical protein [Myxococcales bacterium]
FGSRASFDASAGLDGLWIERAGNKLHVHARVAGRRCMMTSSADEAIVDDGVVRARYDVTCDAFVDALLVEGARGPHRMSGALYLTLRTLVRGVLDPSRVNAVSVRLQT